MGRLCPRRLGSFVQANARRLLLFLILALIALCAANNSIKFDSELSNWIQRTGRIENELQAIKSAIGSGAGTNNLLLLQTLTNNINKPKQQQQQQQQLDRHALSPESDILSVDSLMIHLEALAIATHATVELFDLTWSLKDICFTPTPPDYEGLLPNLMLENMMPCAIKTPLDCFWEGAKLLGPEDYRLSSLGPKIKWTDMNPQQMIQTMQRNHPQSSFPYASLLDWMQRVGITSGYVKKPCLDPTDPNCPTSAPNKLSGETPNIGAHLTGGCSGFASKQMHWREEELFGGVKHNRSGYIEKAEALQSTIQLMAERDVYDYWRKTDKVKDVHNWSTEKAKLVLESWQTKFKQELEQFTKSSLSSNNYKIYAMTPDSMSEPISLDSVADSTNFKLAAAFMTLLSCILFPNFRFNAEETPSNQARSSEMKSQDAKDSDKVKISRIHITLLAITTSILICLTFIASLGLCSFMNLSLNMATSHILPPLALYYGFKQALMIANIYAHNLNRSPIEDLTTECLNELLPETLLEFIVYIIPLMVGLFIPVPAITVFTYQSITYICLATISSVLAIPSLLTSFVTYHYYSSDVSDQDDSAEDQIIFSRLQNDLKNVRADSHTPPTDINFIANFNTNGFSTNLSLRTSPNSQRAKPCDTQTIRLNPNKQPDQTTTTTTTTQQGKTCMDDNVISTLPDLLLWPPGLVEQKAGIDLDDKPEELKKSESPIIKYTSILSNRFVQSTILISRLIIFIAIMSKSFNLEYGLQISDIIVRNTIEHDTFLVQEKYFPIHNIYIVTKGNFDYPNNQRLLHEFHKRIQQVDGVIRDDDDDSSRSKFWLAYFRDWLIELQERFDTDRNRSVISNQGWREDEDVSDNSKLAYKLLAQTGRIENPIDRNQVESNRLVDKNGIINPKSFYYYLTAWVMCDAFSYSSSEVNFRPEPKTWNDNPTELKIERARPINYAQIPFMIRLATNRDTIRALTEIRGISQAFEQLNLANFPTGDPFIFWDQFLNLDLQFFAAVAMVAGSLYLIVALIMSDLLTAAIITAPMVLSLMELYGIIGHLSIPFNNIIAAIMINFLGLAAVQTLHYVIYFTNKEGDVASRWRETIEQRLRIVTSSLVLSLICVLLFRASRIEFMTRYSVVLLALFAINAYNALLVVPVILRLLGKEHKPVKQAPRQVAGQSRKTRSVAQRCQTKQRQVRKKSSSSSSKKRGYPRVQSEISLSTISEEPQSDIKLPDLKLGLSINVNY